MSNLEKYLNEHISGSSAALYLLLVLARKNSMNRIAYVELHQDILVNRLFLERVMAEAGFSRSRIIELIAGATARFLAWRLISHGLSRGGLGLVEALEALELGINGQILLWRTLMQTPPIVPEAKVDFAALLDRAEHRKSRVERLRMDAVQQAFSIPP